MKLSIHHEKKTCFDAIALVCLALLLALPTLRRQQQVGTFAAEQEFIHLASHSKNPQLPRNSEW